MDCAPYQVICSQCGADSDSDTQEFELTDGACPPHADFLLLELLCRSCGTAGDVALWPVDRRAVMRAGMDEVPLGPRAPTGSEVLDRYLEMVEDYRRQWEGFYTDREQRGDFPMLDLSAEDLAIAPDRLTAIPARAVAAARGVRRAVAAHPDELPAGALNLGHVSCVLSLDRLPSSMHPYALHLSAMNQLTQGWLEPAEQALVVSLFFTPEERLLVTAEHGLTRPVIHFRFGCEQTEADEC